MLQIGAYPSEELALSAWNNFRARYATAIGGLTQNVQVADLGERGTWYRLRVGPFNSKDAAVEKCEQLREAGGTCFVAAP
jgi:cell division protein FtsN